MADLMDMSTAPVDGTPVLGKDIFGYYADMAFLRGVWQRHGRQLRDYPPQFTDNITTEGEFAPIAWTWLPQGSLHLEWEESNGQ